MKYVNKGSLVALLFVSAFAGDIALADSVITKPGKTELVTEVRAEIDLRKDDFYQSFAKPATAAVSKQSDVAAQWKNSIYLSIVPARKTKGLIF